MSIQWYPGHMHKAIREFKETLGKVNLVIEIVDARIPYSSENPLLQKLRGDKPCIKVLNKSDLADPQVTQLWQDYLNQQPGMHSCVVNKSQTHNIKELISLSRKLANAGILPDKIVTVLVMGIPNVGKSTLINSLAGRQIAKTGNEPAVTKGQQRIAIDNNVVLIDMPGVLWPNLENQQSAYRLAATGAIKDTALNHEDIAAFIADFLLASYPHALKKRFHLEALPATGQHLINEIGKKRGCLGPGGKVNMDKAAKILIAEFRAGQLGPIGMETPAMMLQEQERVAIHRQEKAEAKAALQTKRKKMHDG